MARAPAESRIPVFLKQQQPGVPPQLPVRVPFTLRPHNEKTSKRPSSLLELFGRNKVGAVPTKPMSVESSVPSGPRNTDAPLNIKSEHVKNFKTTEGGCGPVFAGRDVDTTGAVTSAHVGHRVSVNGTKVGILRYFGEIELTSGVFCGVELDEPVGRHDGSVQGTRYFTCRHQHGIFAPIGIVRLVPGHTWQQPSDVCARRESASLILSESGPYSLLDGCTVEQIGEDGEVEDDAETQQPSAMSTPTPSSVASNAVLWESWSQCRSSSATSSTPSHSHHKSQPSQQLNNQNSLELDEGFGILTSDNISPVGSQSWPQPHHLSQTSLQLSKQSSFELDESLGILTPDQMIDFAVCIDRSTVGRTPSFEDMGIFLLGDVKGDDVEDFLRDRLPSESDGPSSSNYPSSEFPQLPDDAVDSILETAENVANTDHLLLPKAEGVLSSDAATPSQHQSTLNAVFCASEDLSDNVCPAVSKSSDGDFRVGQDISDRTLSPEDLPMDAPFQEVMGEILQKAEVTSESGHDTAGLSGATSAGPSSRSSAAPPAASSFVTSITSITSLDNGYQGDGEWSRPASRGAEHSPTNHRVITLKTCGPDPMTDSDFFTESDADTHDDLGAGTGRGDRRAQVIDGTLYGANLHAGSAVPVGQQHQRCPSFTASINEEMESSGVYSDLERRPEDATSDGKEIQGEEQNLGEENFSPDGSTKTVSSHSEQSQIKELSLTFTTVIQETMSENVGDMPKGVVIASDFLTENNMKNQQALMVLTVTEESMDASVERPTHKTEANSSGAAGNMKSPAATSNSSLSTIVGGKLSKEEARHQLKKYKMPKRNVVSKIKSMIESSPANGGHPNVQDENQENRRPTRSPCKSVRKNGGRWDAVMNKIAQGQAEQKLKSRSLKEVKSKVFANMTSSAGEGTSRRTRKTSSNNVGLSVSSRALKENSQVKVKSRRSRMSLSQQQQQQQQQHEETPGHGATSPNSSPHSSISDVSVSRKHALGKASTKSSSLRSSKKRDVGRSSSPLSDGSVSHAMTRTSRPPLPKNGVSAATVVDMKTPTTRKQASRRITASSGQKPAPLRDHNRQQQAEGAGCKPGVEAPLSSKPGEVAVPSSQRPTSLEILLPHLRHSSAGFEALCVLVHYLVYTLDAFSTPQLRKDLESMKTEWLKTKLKLEESQMSYRRMEDTFKQETVLCRQKIEEAEATNRRELAARDTKHSQESAELVARHEAELFDFEKRLQEQLLEMKGRYEKELSCAQQRHAEELERVAADGRGCLEQVHREHAAALARLQTDTFQREAELRHRLANVEEEYSGLKDQSRKIMDSMQKDKDTKLQVTAGRCKKLQDEVESLQTVLDLRHEELQELRKQNALLTREAQEELPAALQRVAALEAKVEDLKVQLQMKTNLERQLSEHNRLLMESFHQESKQSKRLSLHNEELQWKLKQNLEVVNALAALSGAAMTGPLQASSTNGRGSSHGSAQSLADSDITATGNQMFATRTSPRPLSAGRSHNSSSSDLSVGPASASHSALGEDLETSPPASPKVKGVVEKSDSVSWVVEIDETSEALLSRLVRRAGSFRGSMPPLSSVPSCAHARTLPPPKRQRYKASPLSLSSSATAITRPSISSHSRNIPLTASRRSRSRSMSTDCVEDVGLDYGSWNPETSTPLQNSYTDVGSLQCENDMAVLTNNNKSCLNRCGNLTCVDDNCEDFTQNASSVIHNFSGVSNGAKKRGTSEYSNDEDSPSKSSGSSGSSDGSQKDRSRTSCQNRRQVTDRSGASDSLDLGDPEVLPLPPLPGSTSGDLSLLAAQPLPPPKDSAGEAMISEETSEDENENVDEMNSTSDEHSCSEEEETTSSSGSSSDLRAVPSRGLTEIEDGEIGSACQNLEQEEEEGVGRVTEVTSGQQNNLSAGGGLQQYHLLLMSESATSTAMDLSWSEDMPSESDG